MPTGVYSLPQPAPTLRSSRRLRLHHRHSIIADQSTHIPLKPVVEVRTLPKQSLLIFAGFHTILAWGQQGLAWETQRLSWEGVRITSIEANTLHGLGWNLLTDKEVPFTVDLLTGHHQGGGFAQRIRLES